jgi:cation diffusion facilitator family transporter
MDRSDIARHEHAHVFHFTGTQAQTRTMRVVLLTVVMMVVEIVAGWWFGSMALLADGWHMGTHAAALGISWLAFVLAGRHALDNRFVFGTWKIEILGGFVSAILLGMVGVSMVALSIARILHPVAIRFDEAIFVAVVGLAVNLASIYILAGRPRRADANGYEHAHPHPEPAHDAHHGHAHAHDNVRGNLNLRSAYVHVLADALTSVLAILALLGGRFLHWNWLDPAIGIVGAGLILQWTVSLLRETGGILLDREADPEKTRAIREAIEGDGESRVSDLHVWRVGQGRYACIATVVCDRPQPLEEYKQRLQRLEHVVHATVEIVQAGK